MNADLGPINEEDFSFDSPNPIRDDAQEQDHLNAQQASQLLRSSAMATPVRRIHLFVADARIRKPVRQRRFITLRCALSKGQWALAFEVISLFLYNGYNATPNIHL